MKNNHVITVVNGDARSEYAAARLSSLGFDVSTEVMSGSVIVLPPNASDKLSLCGEVVKTAEFIGSAKPSAVIGPSAAREHSEGAPFFDYSKDENYLQKNAELTAEGAVGIVICSLPFSVRGSRAAVLGYGRIGKSLAKKLVSLGADVTVFARKEAAKKEAEKICRAEDFSAFGGGFDYIMNTVPAKTVDPRLIGTCYVIELASAPFGFDDRCRETLGEMFVFAPGLPGKTAPRPAGYALADAVYDILKGDYFK